MKAVMLSIQPKWCELIASGKKTVEVRKNKPKVATPFKVYIYCTKNEDKKIGHWLSLYCESGQVTTDIKLEEPCYQLNGKVIGEFVCDCIVNYEAELWDDETFERIQEFYEPDDFAEYGEYEYKTVADNSDNFWKDNMLCKASCLTIEKLREYLGCGITEFYGWHISNLEIYDKPKELSEFKTVCKYRNDDNSCQYLKVECACVKFDFNPDYSVNLAECMDYMVRPPQSWCYVEDR